MFDFTPYGTKTTDEVLRIVKNLKLKGYTFLENRKGNKENFFIWQKGKSEEYLRIILLSNGWNSEKLFYWNVEFSFKPFNYRHNHKPENNWQSEEFKGNAEDLYLSRFLEAINRIERRFK